MPKRTLSHAFIFLTANPDVSLAVQAFRLGASGYVLKHAAAEELVLAIRETSAGVTYITPGIAKEVLPRTMEFHQNNIVVKIGLRTTAELARYATRHRLVSEAG